MTHQILPQKWEAVIIALSQPPFSMDQNAIYSSPASAAHEVRKAVAGLVGPPPAALVLTAADLYQLEAVPANAPQWYQDLAGFNAAPDAVTYSTLAGASGQLVHLGLFEHVLYHQARKRHARVRSVTGFIFVILDKAVSDSGANWLVPGSASS